LTGITSSFGIVKVLATIMYWIAKIEKQKLGTLMIGIIAIVSQLAVGFKTAKGNYPDGPRKISGFKFDPNDGSCFWNRFNPFSIHPRPGWPCAGAGW
jgi:hypothetical protein